MTKDTSTIVLFDVDGTLTKARKVSPPSIVAPHGFSLRTAVIRAPLKEAGLGGLWVHWTVHTPRDMYVHCTRAPR